MVVAAQGDVASLGAQLTAASELSGAVQRDAEALLAGCEAFCEQVRAGRRDLTGSVD